MYEVSSSRVVSQRAWSATQTFHNTVECQTEEAARAVVKALVAQHHKVVCASERPMYCQIDVLRGREHVEHVASVEVRYAETRCWKNMAWLTA